MEEKLMQWREKKRREAEEIRKSVQKTKPLQMVGLTDKTINAALLRPVPIYTAVNTPMKKDENNKENNYSGKSIQTPRTSQMNVYLAAIHKYIQEENYSLANSMLEAIPNMQDAFRRSDYWLAKLYLHQEWFHTDEQGIVQFLMHAKQYKPLPYEKFHLAVQQVLLDLSGISKNNGATVDDCEAINKLLEDDPLWNSNTEKDEDEVSKISKYEQQKKLVSELSTKTPTKFSIKSSAPTPLQDYNSFSAKKVIMELQSACKISVSKTPARTPAPMKSLEETETFTKLATMTPISDALRHSLSEVELIEEPVAVAEKIVTPNNDLILTSTKLNLFKQFDDGLEVILEEDMLATELENLSNQNSSVAAEISEPFPIYVDSSREPLPIELPISDASALIVEKYKSPILLNTTLNSNLDCDAEPIATLTVPTRTNAGLVRVLSPIPSSKVQEEVLKTKYYMSPVRRSLRITPKSSVQSKEVLTPLWRQTNYTYVPNKALPDTDEDVIFVGMTKAAAINADIADVKSIPPAFSTPYVTSPAEALIDAQSDFPCTVPLLNMDDLEDDLSFNVSATTSSIVDSAPRVKINNSRGIFSDLRCERKSSSLLQDYLLNTNENDLHSDEAEVTFGRITPLKPRQSTFGGQNLARTPILSTKNTPSPNTLKIRKMATPKSALKNCHTNSILKSKKKVVFAQMLRDVKEIVSINPHSSPYQEKDNSLIKTPKLMFDSIPSIHVHDFGKEKEFMDKMVQAANYFAPLFRESQRNSPSKQSPLKTQVKPEPIDSAPRPLRRSARKAK